MTRAQIATLPPTEGRRAPRRIVNLAASLREPGARVADAEIQNLSVGGFMAFTDMPLEVGADVWLKLRGLEPSRCTVAWVEDGKAGFAFETALHPSTLDMLVNTARKPIRRHFGPQAVTGR